MCISIPVSKMGFSVTTGSLFPAVSLADVSGFSSRLLIVPILMLPLISCVLPSGLGLQPPVGACLWLSPKGGTTHLDTDSFMKDSKKLCHRSWTLNE